jgi:Gas vesicle protein
MAIDPNTGRRLPQPYGVGEMHPREAPSNLADILERVLDKGIVIAGDIQLNLLDIELLTIKIRLLVASVDRAREMGINWWESDPTLTVDPNEPRQEKVSFRTEFERDGDREELEARIERLERQLGTGSGATPSKRASRPASARRATGARGGDAQKR